MGEAARSLDRVNASDPQHWGLRLAQQALAALLEGGERLQHFRVAILRASARTRARPRASGGNSGGSGCVSSRYSQMASDCVSTWSPSTSVGTRRDADTAP